MGSAYKNLQAPKRGRLLSSRQRYQVIVFQNKIFVAAACCH
jgi:hypothetical protein